MGEKEEGKVKVLCGANTQEIEGLVGKTVAEVRQSLTEVLSIPEDAEPYISGDNIEHDGYRLRSGDVLEFIRPSGKKGY